MSWCWLTGSKTLLFSNWDCCGVETAPNGDSLVCEALLQVLQGSIIKVIHRREVVLAG